MKSDICFILYHTYIILISALIFFFTASILTTDFYICGISSFGSAVAVLTVAKDPEVLDLKTYYL